jgi:hypothetical protein
MTDLPAKTAFTDADVTEGEFKTALNNLRDYLSERVQGLTSNTALSDADATLTAAQLVGGEFTITPTEARTQTTDTAANIITALAGSADGSSFEFTVVNLAGFGVTIALGTDVTLVGNMVVGIGSASFRVRRLTSTTVSVTRLGSQSPLVVYHGRVAAGGTSAGGVSGFTISNEGTGHFRVTHNFGTTAYTAQAISSFPSYDTRILAQAANYVDFSQNATSTGAANDQPFSWWLILD